MEGHTIWSIELRASREFVDAAVYKHAYALAFVRRAYSVEDSRHWVVGAFLIGFLPGLLGYDDVVLLHSQIPEEMGLYNVIRLLNIALENFERSSRRLCADGCGRNRHYCSLESFGWPCEPSAGPGRMIPAASNTLACARVTMAVVDVPSVDIIEEEDRMGTSGELDCVNSRVVVVDS